MTNGYKGPKSRSAKNIHLDSVVAIELPDEITVLGTINHRKESRIPNSRYGTPQLPPVDHLVYYSSSSAAVRRPILTFA